MGPELNAYIANVLQESALSTDCTHCDHQCHHRHLSCFSMQSTVTPQIPAFVHYHGRQCYLVTIVNPGTIVTMVVACVTPKNLSILPYQRSSIKSVNSSRIVPMLVS